MAPGRRDGALSAGGDHLVRDPANDPPAPRWAARGASALAHSVLIGGLLLPRMDAVPPDAPDDRAVLTVELVSRPDARRGQPSQPAPTPAPANPAPPTQAGGPAPMLKPSPAAPRQAATAVNLGDAAEDDEALTVTSNLQPPGPDARFRNQPPHFPREASRQGQFGTVRLVVHVTAAGAAGLVETVESSGVPSLDAASLEAVARWHFTPALRDGVAVESIYPIEFNFRKNP